MTKRPSPPLRGVRIVSVVRKLPGEIAGLRAGDIILAINGREMTRAQEVLDAIAALPGETPATFRVLRASTEINMTVKPQF